MNPDTFAALVSDRLDHLSDHVEVLTLQGDYDSAGLLRTEGFALAGAFDRKETFLVLGEVTAS
jgi:hypothetical protein